jgi:uncharacterized protein (DUF1501 family)
VGLTKNEKNMNRRNFLRDSSLVTVGTFMVPAFLKASSRLSPDQQSRKLIVIQLSGGNDGLNTIVPYRNDIYYRERPTLSLDSSKIISLTDEIGLNPELKALADVYTDGRMRIINNVGYPNPDRSHFRSMDIWQSASGAEEYLTTGWLGRFLDSECVKGKSMPYKVVEIDESLSLALKGKKQNGMAVLRPSDLYRATKSDVMEVLKGVSEGGDEDAVGYLYKTLAETRQSAAYFYEKEKVKRATGLFPDTELGRGLKTVASMIGAGVDTSVYYLSISGFDTHAGQRGRQDKLLGQYAEAVAALVKELKNTSQLDHTMILTFSEFGRRVRQNGSNGTDHGAANAVFLIGGPPRNKVSYSESPHLSELNAGDLKYEIDFRDIYASLLTDWLGANGKTILGSSYAGLPGLI